MQNDKIKHAINSETATTVKTLLSQGWQYCQTAANAFQTPAELPEDTQYTQAVVPSTTAVLACNQDKLSEQDNLDHWYVLAFDHPDAQCDQFLLHLDGLLTYADVFLNGQLLLQSTNAYHVHFLDITKQLSTHHNQLCICFRAIKPIYSKRHPRPRYITRLVNERNLRFIRTPVIGYTPGFSAPTKLVGPYRKIQLIGQQLLNIQKYQVICALNEGNQGIVNAQITLNLLNNTELQQAQLAIQDPETNETIASVKLDISVGLEAMTLNAQAIELSNIQAYWPHTHGSPKRYRVLLEVFTQVETLSIELGQYGFRRIEKQANCFNVLFNGIPLFLRGACWTPADPARLMTDKKTLSARLHRLKQAGFNLLRIPGNMVYESDDFYELCDALGILIFQDFTFTNFDYPETPEFIESVKIEIEDFLNKHGNRPSLTFLCGGSEIAQQSGMMGTPIAEIDHPLFKEIIPSWVAQLAPQTIYAVSSPYASGQLPFHVGADGPSQYFGVGGYLRSLEDARLFNGSFITECLPFSHTPEEDSLQQFWGGVIPPSHHPLWKDGVTRDPGSGWDFSDITDYYLEQRFNVNAVRTRAIDPSRYRDLSRAVVVDIVEATMSIFRASAGAGRAALVWNLNDLKPGAGWGYIDILGMPKSAFYALARTAQPTTLLFVDEGLEGLALTIAHDGEKTISCQLNLALITQDGKSFASHTTSVTLTPRSLQKFNVDTLIGHFVDASDAFRFGPRAIEACVAKLTNESGELISQKVHIHPESTTTTIQDAAMTAVSTKINDSQQMITLSCRYPAYFVNIQTDAVLNDNYFHLMPGYDYIVYATSQETKIQGRVRALNVKTSIAIQ